MTPMTPAGTPKAGTRSLSSKQRRIIFSPLSLVAVLAVSIFVIELVVMVLLDQLKVVIRFSETSEMLLDATTLTLCLFLIMYYFLFKPQLQLIREFRDNEQEMRAGKQQLEQKIIDRTQELNEAVRTLLKENTERRLAEEALRTSEERFREVFEQSEDAIILVESQHAAFIDANPIAESIFQKQRDELLQGGFSALFQTDELLNVMAELDEIILGNKRGGIEQLMYQTGSSEQRILSFRGKTITLAGSTIVYCTFRDITHRVRLEEEAREIQARLIQANRMTSLGLLVTSVAHEINNPNNFILVNAGLLKQAWKDIAPILDETAIDKGDYYIGHTPYSEASAFLPEAIDSILDGSQRISEIVANLKDFGKDVRQSSNESSNINAVTRLAVSMLNHHIAKCTRRFVLELGEHLPPVQGDPRQLEQVIINLITNALQSLTHPDQMVRVTTGMAGDLVTLRVEDNGCGIPDTIANRVMEPFFTTKLEQGGTGLGLAISSAIIQDRGGELSFSSKPDHGTVFTISLRPALSPADTGNA